eukprot:SAG31_NODE_2643_length_5320_cov_13.447998_2_plen_88_part_00
MSSDDEQEERRKSIDSTGASSGNSDGDNDSDEDLVAKNDEDEDANELRETQCARPHAAASSPRQLSSLSTGATHVQHVSPDQFWPLG